MNELEHWEALADADACGDALPSEARSFLADFPHPDAQHERAVYAELAACGHASDVASGAQRQAAQLTMTRWNARQQVPPGRRRVLALSGALLAAAASVALWWAVPTPTVVQAERDATQVASGSLMLDHAVLGAGASLPIGRWVVAKSDACIRSNTAHSCVEPGARVRARTHGLEIATGTLRTDGAGTLHTPQGTLWTDAAVFVVAVGGDEAVVLTVESGRVTLGGDGADRREFGPGTHHLGSVAPVRLVDAAPHNGVPGSIGPPVEPDTASAPATPGRATRGGRRKNAASRGLRRAPDSNLEPEPSAGDLLATARGHVARGEDRLALATYRQLQQAHPRSGAAKAANVSVGEVHLRLGDGAAALLAFDAYLGGGGRALAEEALWGRIRSLHRLRRSAARDAAISRLSARFPDSVYRARATSL